jgi:GNAT superfamily N-acetyltransferase
MQTLCVMTRPTDPAPEHDDGDIEVVPVMDAEALEAFTQVMAQGFGGDVGRLRQLHGVMHDQRPRRTAMFVARWQGQVPAAAAAASFVFDDSVYLQGGVVLPDARGRGLYRALVAARLDHAHAAGRRVATTHAHHRTSAPILARLGFATLARLPCYGPA